MQIPRLRSLGICFCLFCIVTLQATAQSLAIIPVGGDEILATSISQFRGTAVIIINNQAFPLATINNQPVVILNGQVIIITVAQFVGSGGNIIVNSQETVAFTTIRSGTGTQAVTLTSREIQQLTASQRIMVVQQLSSDQLRQLTSSQAAAFGIIGSQNTQSPPPLPQEQQLTNSTNLSTNSTIENVVPSSANSTVDAGKNQTDTSEDDAEMEIFKRDLISDESDVGAAFVAEAMEVKPGKRGTDPVDLRKKRRMKFRTGGVQ